MQFAVFVDAGYLMAEGGKLIAGQKVPRSNVSINIVAFLDLLGTVAASRASGMRLLRVYWYDGMLRGSGLTVAQQNISMQDNVKLRLGMVNSRGEQKEVDALIVTDLVDLARNRSISDAILISGDGDIRIGVQIAQSHGVRVHLVGVEPAKDNQSPELRAEADTLTTLDESHLRQVMEANVAVAQPTSSKPVSERLPLAKIAEPARPITGIDFQTAVTLIATEILASEVDLSGRLAAIDAQSGNVPADIDRPALSRLGQLLGRTATYRERALFRDEIVRAIRNTVEHQ